MLAVIIVGAGLGTYVILVGHNQITATITDYSISTMTVDSYFTSTALVPTTQTYVSTSTVYPSFNSTYSTVRYVTSSLYIPALACNSTGKECDNFSALYEPIGTGDTSVVDTSYISGVTIQVRCDGCLGAESDNKSSATVSPDVPPQWNGTFGPDKDIPRNISFMASLSGICDFAYGIFRPSDAARWNVSWAFEKQSLTGTMEVIVSLMYNNTIVFDRSTRAQYATIAGTFEAAPNTLMSYTAQSRTSTSTYLDLNTSS